MKKIIIFLFIIFTTNWVLAQNEICGLITQNQDHLNISHDLQNPIQIPVFYHIILDTDGTGNISNNKLTSQITVLNQRYSNTYFSFYLLGITRTKNPNWRGLTRPYHGLDSLEIEMKENLAIDPDHVLNIYITQLEDDNSTIQGWATLASDTQINSNHHGVVIRPEVFPNGSYTNFNLGITLVHEVGHYLGLKHTFYEDAVCKYNNDPDDCADTPPHLVNKENAPESTDTCPNDEKTDPVHNYMNYTWDNWRNVFTSDQRYLMRSETAKHRAALGEGSIYITKNRIINTGDSWEILRGNYNFLNNTSLKVYGTLNVNGTSSSKVTFNFINDNNSNGIKFYQGSGGTIDNAIIKNARYGVYVYKSSPTIKNCVIHDCEYGIKSYYNSPTIETNEIFSSYYGIYLYKGNAIIRDNYIHNTTNYGIVANSVYNSTFIRENTLDYCSGGVYAYGNNSVKLRGGNGQSSYGKNIIKNYGSRYAVYITGGTPDLGEASPSSHRGYNNFYRKSGTYVVKNTTGNEVMAERNYWGSSSPSSSWFYGDFDWYDYLSSPYSSAGSSLDKSANTEPDKEMLYEANELVDSKNYIGGSDKYKQLVADYPESKYGGVALSWSMATHQLTNDLETQREYLQKHVNHKNKRVSNSAKLWLQTLESESGNKDASEKVVNSTDINTLVGTEIRLNWANDLLNIYDDEQGANEVFDELTKAGASESTLETIDIIKRTAINNKEVEKTDNSEKFSKSNENNKETENGYSIQNYPNPFNPSTTLSYLLPTTSNVKLEIYDVMGRMIKSLTTNTQSSGKHQVVWDGTNSNGVKVSTGIYIYRFEATSIETNEHFVKAEKLMLVK